MREPHLLINAFPSSWQDACIIPLDEAAKQLIQLEETENEEDRQLKSKFTP